ncbi:WXG100 family type VII secretion target [Streptomyces andamanensis]|uniref:WXG100 family type VII secretion target n=1 Tax=Streptomyces andamanensis TaxID=1565035 RepID=A0ABV8TK44_9ACTN
MGIDANFSVMSSVVSEMEEQARIMNSTIDNLQQELAAYTQSWVGADRQAYNDVNTTWDSCQGRAQQLLSSYHETLHHNMTSLSRASASNRDNFQSITI